MIVVMSSTDTTIFIKHLGISIKEITPPGALTVLLHSYLQQGQNEEVMVLLSQKSLLHQNNPQDGVKWEESSPELSV